MLSEINLTTYHRSTMCRDNWSVVCFRTVAQPCYWRENTIESSVLHNGGLRGPKHIPHVSTILLVWENYILASILTSGDLGRVSVNSEVGNIRPWMVNTIAFALGIHSDFDIDGYEFERYTHSYPYAIEGACQEQVAATSAAVYPPSA